MILVPLFAIWTPAMLTRSILNERFKYDDGADKVQNAEEINLTRRTRQSRGMTTPDSHARYNLLNDLKS